MEYTLIYKQPNCLLIPNNNGKIRIFKSFDKAIEYQLKNERYGLFDIISMTNFKKISDKYELHSLRGIQRKTFKQAERLKELEEGE